MTVFIAGALCALSFAAGAILAGGLIIARTNGNTR